MSDPVLSPGDWSKITDQIYPKLVDHELCSGTVTTIITCIIVMFSFIIVLYSLYIVYKSKWSLETVLHLELILVSSLVLPIGLLHPHILLVSNKYIMLSMTYIQNEATVQILILLFYHTIYYTFSSIIALIAAQFLRKRAHRGNLVKGVKLTLSLINIPLTAIFLLGLSFFWEFVDDQRGRFVILDVSKRSYMCILIVFCVIFTAYAFLCYFVHEKMEYYLESATEGERSHEQLYLELQMLIGSYYAVLPFLLLFTTFISTSTDKHIIISEIVTLSIILQPLCICFVILARYDCLRFPEPIARLWNCGRTKRQWATPRNNKIIGV